MFGGTTLLKLCLIYFLTRFLEMGVLKSSSSKISNFLKKIGPGVVTGISDDDPSGIATYSQAGARFGLSFLWSALLTYPLMFAIQSMCAKIGITHSSGIVKVMLKYYPKWLSYLLLLLIMPAIILNIGANLAGMSAVANLLMPIAPSIALNLFIALSIFLGLTIFSYKNVAKILKYFCIAFIAYFIVPFLVETNWKSVVWHTFIPTIQMKKEFLTMLIAILGTTISPYLFFWQAFMSMENFKHNHDTQHTEIKNMNIDVNLGMLISNLVMFFIILTTGSTLFPEGIKNIDNVEQAALALKPLAGNFAYEIFSFGVLASGIIANSVLAACIGYICGELFNIDFGLDKRFFEAPKFYAIIFISLGLGFVLNLFNIDPIKSLILTAIIYGFTAPIFIAFILHMCNSKKIMKKNCNGFVLNALGGLTFCLMTGAAIGLIFTLL